MTTGGGAGVGGGDPRFLAVPFGLSPGGPLVTTGPGGAPPGAMCGIALMTKCCCPNDHTFVVTQ